MLLCSVTLVLLADKTIKFWKIYEKKVRMVSSRNVEVRICRVQERDSSPSLTEAYSCALRSLISPVQVRKGGVGNNVFIQSLRMPTLHPVQSIATASLKRTFSNGHTYHINSLSFSPDGETYLSCLLYTSPSPRDRQKSRMPSSA